MLWQINMPAAAFHSITISLVITHNLSAALAVLLFCISALPLQSVSPDLQTNGNVTQTSILSVWFCFARSPDKWKAHLTRLTTGCSSKEEEEKNTSTKWNLKRCCGWAVECDDKSVSATSSNLRRQQREGDRVRPDGFPARWLCLCHSKVSL